LTHPEDWFVWATAGALATPAANAAAHKPRIKFGFINFLTITQKLLASPKQSRDD
jgi:hypothetical protein